MLVYFNVFFSCELQSEVRISALDKNEVTLKNCLKHKFEAKDSRFSKIPL